MVHVQLQGESQSGSFQPTSPNTVVGPRLTRCAGLPSNETEKFNLEFSSALRRPILAAFESGEAGSYIPSRIVSRMVKSRQRKVFFVSPGWTVNFSVDKNSRRPRRADRIPGNPELVAANRPY